MASLVGAWRRSRRGILTATSILIGLIIVGILVAYVVTPGEEVASLGFRLVFQGADRNQYPNGTEFRVSDIVTTSVLRAAWEQNDLQRYLSFDEFSSSVLVTESNPALDRLNLEYNARLAEPKLPVIERQRLEQEFAVKRQSLSRTQYALNLLRRENDRQLPPPVIEGALRDILKIWAEHAALEKGALRFSSPALSENILPSTEEVTSQPLIIADILRVKIADVRHNIDSIRQAPGADTLRTKAEGIGLAEIDDNLEDVRRFRLEPLMVRLGGGRDPEKTREFIEGQLAYNRLRRAEAQSRVEAMRQTLELYVSHLPDSKRELSDADAGEAGGPVIDRLVAVSIRAADWKYRQERADEITHAALDVVPYDSEISHYETLLQRLVSPNRRTGTPLESFGSDISAVASAIRDAIRQTNEIHASISANLNSFDKLFLVTEPMQQTVERAISWGRLVLIGVLALIAGVPLILVLAVARMRMQSRAVDARPLRADSSEHGTH